MLTVRQSVPVAGAAVACITVPLKWNGMLIQWNTWGYYGRYIGICADTELHVSYKIVELIFDGMWKGYHLVDANCQHWARDFYIRVERSRASFYAMMNGKGTTVGIVPLCLPTPFPADVS
ncbi:hypothetical protein GPALN_013135 [Globodera pallida]|nr:hypothetical protein GPALN_013135 [Globodera pallida]